MAGYPGQLVKVDLDAFAVVGTAAIRGEVLSAVVEPTGRFAYLASGAGFVERFDLTSFQVVDEIAYSGNVDGFGCSGVLHPTGRSAYFGLMHEATLVRIDLPGFTGGTVNTMAPRADVLHVGADGVAACSAVVDPVGQYAYVGVSSWPRAKVVKVRVGPEPVLVTRLLTTYTTTTGWGAHLAADMTGNGRADLVSYHPSNGSWWITSSRPDGTFHAPRRLTTYTTRTGWTAHLAADMTGNGRAELVSYHPSNGSWWLTSSRPDGTFEAPKRAGTYVTRDGWEAHRAADVTGNGRAELLSFHPQQSPWFISPSRPNGTFGPQEVFTIYATTGGWAAHVAADVTGNGRADLLSYHAARGRWWATMTVPG
jgi:hypothetical protein